MRRSYAFRAVGACFDLPPEAAPADRWTVCVDATFPEGVATVPDGEAREYTSTAAVPFLPRHLAYVGHDMSSIGASRGRNVWWLVGGSAIYQVGDTGVTPADRTPATPPTGSALGDITSGVLNGYGFVSMSGSPNGLYYGLAGGVAPLTSFVPATNDCFRAVRAYRYHLVGLARWNPVTLTDYPQRVSWSSAAAPGSWPATWAPAATNEAGSVDLADCRGLLVDGGRLADDFLIYAEGSTHVMTYTGGQAVMAFRGVSSQSGVFGRNCIADLGVAHFVLTADDVVLADAREVRSVAAGWVRRRLFGAGGALTASRRAAVHVLHHRARGEVWICHSASGDPYCDEALVWSQASGAWGHRRLPLRHVAGATGFTTLTDLRHQSPAVLLLASRGADTTPTDQRLYIADEPLAGVFEARNCTLGRHDLDLGLPRQLKQPTAVRPRFRTLASGGSGWQVRVGGRNSATEAITWSAWASYAPATDDDVPFSGISGRLIAVEMRCAPSTVPWQLVGFDLEYETRGER